MFKTYLQQLQQKFYGSESENIPSPNTFTTESNHRGIVFKSQSPFDVEQSLCGQKDTGYALAICTITNQFENKVLYSNLTSCIENGPRSFCITKPFLRLENWSRQLKYY